MEKREGFVKAIKDGETQHFSLRQWALMRNIRGERDGWFEVDGGAAMPVTDFLPSELEAKRKLTVEDIERGTDLEVVSTEEQTGMQAVVPKKGRPRKA